LAGTDAIVAWKLPNYAAALAPMRPYLAGVFVAALALPLRLLLVTIGAAKQVLVAQIGALALATGLSIAAAVTGRGILGIAEASAVAALVLLASLLVLAARRSLLTNAAALRVLVETILFAAA